MEGKSKGSRGLEAYCKRGQGPPRAVAPPKKKKNLYENVPKSEEKRYESKANIIELKSEN